MRSRLLCVAAAAVALACSTVRPLHEPGPFRAPDLVDLTTISPTLQLDVRYATAESFLGEPVYDQASAFLQRPAVEMPSGYDDFSERAHPDHAGGSPAARRHRDLLGAAMEDEGFEVYAFKWWHFDYRDWREYPILDLSFAELVAD